MVSTRLPVPEFHGTRMNVEDAGGVQVGDRVIFKAEWQDAGDHLVVFRVVEPESGGSFVVRDENNTLTIKPTQVVSVDMVEWIERP